MASFAGNNERLEERKFQFKTTLDSNQVKEQRAENHVQIRKNKRNQQLAKRRMFSSAENSGAQSREIDPFTVEKFKDFVEQLQTTDVQQLLSVATKMRQIVVHDQTPPIDCLVASGAVPLLVNILRTSKVPELICEVTWVITNTCSGTHEETRTVVDAGATPVLVNLLTFPDVAVQEQAMWALGNIAGDCTEFRDLCITAGTLDRILAIFAGSASKPLTQNAVWTLSNLLRGKPSPPFPLVLRCLPSLCNTIRMTDADVVSDSCYALNYLTDPGCADANNRIQAVIESGVVQKLVELLLHPKETVTLPALLTLSNIVTGDKIQTQVVISCNALFHFDRLLQSQNFAIRKETCFAISNITLGTHGQISSVLRANLLQRLVAMVVNEPHEIQREIGFVFANITRGTTEHIANLVARGSIVPMVQLLKTGRDPQLVTTLLAAFNNIFKAGEESLTEYGENKYTEFFDEADGLSLLEQFATGENVPEDISKLSQYLLDSFFCLDEEDEHDKAFVQPGQEFNADSIPAPPKPFYFS